MTEILIEDEQQKEELTDELITAVKRVIEYTLEYEDCDFDAEVSVTFTDDDGIREINREHRDIDRPTDVLSFPMLEFDENGNAADDFDTNENGYIMLGDIVISLERAKRQAEEYGHSLVRETAFLTAHSMLHLLGYDHVNGVEEEALMFRRQEEILTKLGYVRE